MDGRAIAAGAVSDGGLRRLVTEAGGARPAGTAAAVVPERGNAAVAQTGGPVRATKP